MVTPDDVMRDGWPHHRRFIAALPTDPWLLDDPIAEALVDEWFDEDGTVERTVTLRTFRGDCLKPVPLEEVK